MANEIPEPIREQCESKGGIKGIKKKLPGNDAIEEQSKVFQALSDPLRLKILAALVEQPLCVCLVKEVLGDISDSKLSYHINILKGSGMIIGERQGSWIIYSSTDAGREAMKIAGRL